MAKPDFTPTPAAVPVADVNPYGAGGTPESASRAPATVFIPTPKAPDAMPKAPTPAKGV